MALDLVDTLYPVLPIPYTLLSPGFKAATMPTRSLRAPCASAESVPGPSARINSVLRLGQVVPRWVTLEPEIYLVGQPQRHQQAAGLNYRTSVPEFLHRKLVDRGHSPMTERRHNIVCSTSCGSTARIAPTSSDQRLCQDFPSHCQPKVEFPPHDQWVPLPPICTHFSGLCPSQIRVASRELARHLPRTRRQRQYHRRRKFSLKAGALS